MERLTQKTENGFAIKLNDPQNECDTDYYEFEVIGNIHDNPELTKGE